MQRSDWPDRPCDGTCLCLKKLLSINCAIINLNVFIAASPNMVSGKLGLRMTTLHEETSNVGNQASTPVNDDDEEKSDADYSEYEAYQVTCNLDQKSEQQS